MEHLEGAALTLHVELVPRPALERLTAVAPDLAGNAEVAEECEGPPGNSRAGHVQVHRDLALATEVDRPGGVKERGELRELVALPPRGDCGELVANVLRQRHGRIYDHSR